MNDEVVLKKCKNCNKSINYNDIICPLCNYNVDEKIRTVEPNLSKKRKIN